MRKIAYRVLSLFLDIFISLSCSLYLKSFNFIFLPLFPLLNPSCIQNFFCQNCGISLFIYLFVPCLFYYYLISIYLSLYQSLPQLLTFFIILFCLVISLAWIAISVYLFITFGLACYISSVNLSFFFSISLK